MIKTYQKLPVEVQALLWDGENLEELRDFCKKDFLGMWSYSTSTILIKTLEGEHLANQGDYIIKGVKNEFYPCKPEIFEMTYELS